jgi:hypothetical protein
MTKYVTEDWSHFNRAVLARLGYAERPAEASTPGGAAGESTTAIPPKEAAPPMAGLAQRVSAPFMNSTSKAPPAAPPAVTGGDGFKILRGLVGVSIAVGVILMIANVIQHRNGPALHASVPSYTPLAHTTPTPASIVPEPASPITLAVKTEGGERRVENYTKFSSVDYREGSVITGWVYGNNVEQAPRHEYCYYLTTDPTTNVDNKFDLQNKGGAPNPYPMSPALDLSPAQWQEALSKCHWSSPARPTAPTN